MRSIKSKNSGNNMYLGCQTRSCLYNFLVTPECCLLRINMSEEKGCKLSFSFSKVKTRPLSLIQSKKTNDGLEYISSIENKKIKLVNGEHDVKEKAHLVIPSKKNTTKRIVDSVKSEQNVCKSDVVNDKEETNNSNKHSLLEQLAIKELLQNSRDSKASEKSTLMVPLSSNVSPGEKESSLKDYEEIPIEDFGMAMLRGMGWSPGKGIGKQGKINQLSVPSLRPKGMGLGVDSVNGNNSLIKTDMQLIKGSYVKSILGVHKGNYGQVEGFCDSSGRVIVKLADNQSVITVNEFSLATITKQMYKEYTEKFK